MRKKLSALVVKLDHIFNRLYSSEFNPLYRSGTVAIALLTVVIVSGTYLTFFYRLGEPYESILALQQNLWFGRWIRSLHRYASDALIFSVIAHVVRMYLQGKSWGPRTLAWITGVVLWLLMLVSGWTGFIMVWDTQGQAVAVGLANVLDSMGIMADPVGRSFSGVEHPPSSFFFLNLFIHIVVPLTMIFGLWLHTSKMARATWLPHNRLFYGLVGVFVGFSILWPAPLMEKADLLKTLNEYPLNWLYNLGIPLTLTQPLTAIWVTIIATCFFIAVPWITRPRKEDQKPPSENDQKNCRSCSQCVKDCPYEAIHMVPRTAALGAPGTGDVAEVKPWLCVSCGLCSASCAPFTIGVPGRKGGDQLRDARQFVSAIQSKGQNPKEQILIVGCGFQGEVLKNITKFVSENSGFQVFSTNCTGTIHAAVYGYLALNSRAIAIVNCPPRNCTNKDAAQLLSARLSGELEPTFPRDIQREKTHLLPTGDGEESDLFARLLAIRDDKPAPPKSSRSQAIVAVAVSFAILFILSWATHFNYGEKGTQGLLRLSFRLTGQNEKICRARTSEELDKLLPHMRTNEVCETKPVSYHLTVSSDGVDLFTGQVVAGGLRHDRPIYVDRDFSLPPGERNIKIEFRPAAESAPQAARVLAMEKTIRFSPGRIVLVHTSSNQSELIIKGDTP